MAGEYGSGRGFVAAQLDGGIKMIFQLGDQLQRGMVDVAYGALTGDAATPRLMFKTALDMAQCMAAAASALTSERESRLAWLELQNKLEAFNLFAHVDLALELPRDGVASLAELVGRAAALDPYRSVWATEGIGHLYAEQRPSAADAVNLKGEVGRLPESSLAALHAGAGLSLAGGCLGLLAPGSSDAELRQSLEQFIALCDESAEAGYEGAAYEALGLAARNLHPQLLSDIDRHLCDIGEDLVGYFWHGVGRGIYFTPTNFLPNNSEPWRAVGQTRQEPPHELGRLNALAGLVWALTLVNIRHPEVIESFLLHHVRDAAECDAFVNGLSSALIIWRGSSPDDAALRGLRRHRPAEPQAAELWDVCVNRPCAEVSRHYYPAFSEHGCLGLVFRYQSLPELIAHLERGAAGAAGDGGR
ncbi:MAG TPA: hypothetical protein VEZ40_17505 [Pyrinomonadaceae bacterium]|nr:hypothetical protein [Pyrinomonadaceae bacterium]